MDPDLDRAAGQAITSAATKLGLDPHVLAARLADGEIADLVLELELLSRLILAGQDRDRALKLAQRLQRP